MKKHESLKSKQSASKKKRKQDSLKKRPAAMKRSGPKKRLRLNLDGRKMNEWLENETALRLLEHLRHEIQTEESMCLLLLEMPEVEEVPELVEATATEEVDMAEAAMKAAELVDLAVALVVMIEVETVDLEEDTTIAVEGLALQADPMQDVVGEVLLTLEMLESNKNQNEPLCPM